MNVDFFKNDKPIESTEFVQFLESAVYHFLGMWGVSNENYSIIIDLALDQKNYDYTEGDDIPLGGTFKLSDETFLVFLNIDEMANSFGKDSPKYWMYLLQALAHECTHVKQYIKGELDYDENSDPLWMGKKISNLKYENTPQEIEAYDYQEDMAIDFFVAMSYADLD